ncbi:MAG TPA: cytochrome c [Gammaproteobacteria bacterium]
MNKGDVVAVTLLALALWSLTGCEESAQPAGPSTLKVARSYDSAQVARGKALFALHCARCHGESAQGDVAWRRRNADGTFPPPPLDGSGHAWHHPRHWLREMIRNGSAPQGNMPAWAGQLNERQIDDIIAWFQSLWPDEVYSAWWEMEQRSQRGQ